MSSLTITHITHADAYNASIIFVYLRYISKIRFMAYEKSKSKSVSMVPSLWQRVEEKAGTGAGARSHYIRNLVERDLEQDSQCAELDAETPLTSLITSYFGYILPRYKRAQSKIGEFDEVLFLRNLIEQGIIAMNKGWHKKLNIYDEEEIQRTIDDIFEMNMSQSQAKDYIKTGFEGEHSHEFLGKVAEQKPNGDVPRAE